MKTVVLALMLGLACGAARAQDVLWVLDAETTPLSLVEQAAVLLETESIAWPDGGSVELSYWQGVAGNVYRCAELRSLEVPKTGCWLRVAAEPSTRAADLTRTYRTNPRPVAPYRDWEGSNVYPQVWVRDRRLGW